MSKENVGLWGMNGGEKQENSKIEGVGLVPENLMYILEHLIKNDELDKFFTLYKHFKKSLKLEDKAFISKLVGNKLLSKERGIKPVKEEEPFELVSA